MKEKYLVIIDTEEYAGNFERQMCAYITGQIGDCGVGQKEAQIFESDVTDDDTIEFFEEEIITVQDHNGCYRPVKLSDTPGWFNDGLGSHYKIEGCDFEKVLEKYNREANVHSLPKRTIEDVKNHQYPAYQSIEILFSSIIPENIFNLIAERAIKYTKDDRISIYNKCSKIISVRAVKKITKINYEEIYRKGILE